MRWFLQIAAMLGDVMLFVCCAIVIHDLKLTGVILSVLAFQAFNKAGGFETWKPSFIKQFFKNAKKIGL